MHSFHVISNSLILTVVIGKCRNFESVQNLKLGDEFQRDMQAVCAVIYAIMCLTVTNYFHYQP